jgi:DNA polymerase-3 subunit gamma/tau
LGAADEELLFAFGEALAEREVGGVLELIRKGIEEGRSTTQMARDLVSHFRNLLHVKVSSGETLELTQEYLKRLKVQAEKFTLARIKEILQALSRAELDMRWHPQARLVLEVALLELLGGSSLEEKYVVKTKEDQNTCLPAGTVRRSEVSEEHKIAKIKGHWRDILESVKKKSIFGYVSLHEGEPLEVNAKGKLVIVFHKGYAFHKERLEDAANKQAVEEAVRELTGEKIPIECVIGDGKKTPTIPAAAVAEFFEGRVV